MGAGTLSLEPVWTEPFELGVADETDDPLGFRAAANRLASYMVSPITGRTVSLRQLSLFCFCAASASRWSDRAIDMDIFDRAVRSTVIASTAVLQQYQGELAQPTVRALTLAGRRRASTAAQRLRSETATADDFERPLLAAERSQGLWGTYAALARSLGFLSERNGQPVLTSDGRAVAGEVRFTYPWIRWDWFADPVDAIRAAKKFVDEFEPMNWPVLDAEVKLFRQSLDRPELRSRDRVEFLLEFARHHLGPRAMLRYPEAAVLVGTDGTSLRELAVLAHQARYAVEVIEQDFRDRVRLDAEVEVPDLACCARLIEWAGKQGLAAGALSGVSTWSQVDRYHRKVMHRRGRPAWTDLSALERQLITAEATAPDFRLAALRRIGAELDAAEVAF